MKQAFNELEFQAACNAIIKRIRLRKERLLKNRPKYLYLSNLRRIRAKELRTAELAKDKGEVTC